MTLKEIYSNNEISARAFNTCVDNKIGTISELREIYSNYGSFKPIRNCGEKTNLELISICLKYFEDNEAKVLKDLNSNEVPIQIMITSLNQNQQNLINNFIVNNYSKLSHRTKNGLETFLEGEISLNGFFENIFSMQSFKPSELTNLGVKSIPELETYLKGVESYIIKIHNLKDDNELILEKALTFENKLERQFKNLNHLQIQIVNHHIQKQFHKLSNRSQNALSAFLERQIDIYNISDRIFSNANFNFKTIENIGAGTYGELELFTNEIKLFINEIIEIDKEKKLIGLKLKLFLEEEFYDVEIDQNILPNNSIFSIIQFLIDKQAFLGINKNYILKNGLLIHENFTPQNLVQLAENTKLTKERCRQIRVKLLEELENKLSFFKRYNQDLVANYNIDFHQPSIYITDEIASKINAFDETKFTKQFITLIFSFFCKNEYELIGNQEDVLITTDFTVRQRYAWKNLYLVSNELSKIFDFGKFIEDINEKISKPNNKKYSLNCRSYSLFFFKSDDYTLIDEIIPICKMLLKEELGVYLDNEGNIIIKRNTFKTLPEYAYEALEILGKPSHIDEINNQIKILKPEYNNNIKSGSLKRVLGFVPYGRTSVFGLKKWDYEKENIKGGTIRSIVQEFLENHSTPVHIKKITEFVLKYRPESNSGSIITNLKLDKHDIFVFFNDSYVGLESKKQEYFENSVLNSNKNLVSITFNKSERNNGKTSISDQTSLDFPA
jgi:hypothetical protein